MRWDALALVGVLLVAIGVWVLRLHESLGPALRFDDVCFVLLGAIPGAVVGGRLVHVLDYADSYLPRPLTMLDLGHGSASLVGAVVGGALSAAYICRLLGGRIGVWADAAAVPMLLAIGLGKLAVHARWWRPGRRHGRAAGPRVRRSRTVALDRRRRRGLAVAGARGRLGAAGHPGGPGAGDACSGRGGRAGRGIALLVRAGLVAGRSGRGRAHVAGRSPARTVWAGGGRHPGGPGRRPRRLVVAWRCAPDRPRLPGCTRPYQRVPVRPVPAGR